MDPCAPKKECPKLQDLGITHIEEWRKGISQPDGLCLVCGPTGSGKSFTLHASIRSDELSGMRLLDIQNTLSADLKQKVDRCLRAGPEAVLVDEIRSSEDVSLILKTAGTGHLVLTTMQANSIQEALQRLSGELTSNRAACLSVLRAVLCQKLVKKICSTCSGQKVDDKGAVCADCGGSGSDGYTLVSECVFFNNEQEVEAALAGHYSWPSIAEDAYEKVRQGFITEQEAVKVVGQELSGILKATSAA
ncbi:ATPase, T2SS/T4P/T4SS family [Thalassospira xianhensis]|uniref:Bacterial type II secretion system protein E domain-containing protein n=1 Tax=Thalassospira xianhensis MCCC 1A02616 TaxID=1177929 RepID=A0A367UDD1_9PROT|nr:ATPase, T2SS/T4P/T4SS family [Thalassospira xianhensis]RCK06327.1 hypothetical protein TH5_08990 [Thalassospira xianhensis MCCC 1A02616]